ncbi:MAG TPA: TetR/AcrR family transcriptional regulator [Solirubrobacteraceae bacterium]
MTDEQPTRPYRMRRRAELQQETRRRITESAVALHGTLGPSRTSLSAVADHAGVRRSTLYRHFPDEAALFDACSQHWALEHPLPDLQAWAGIADPDERLRVAIDELYAYFRGAEPMLTNLLRDASISPLVAERFAGWGGWLGAARDILLRGRGARGGRRRRARAAIGHAIAFGTWTSLVRDQGLSDTEAAALMRALVAGCS